MVDEEQPERSVAADGKLGSLVIAAPPEQIMQTIADFAAYPEWVSSIAETEVLEVGADGLPSRVRFVLDAEVVSDEYVLAYSWAEDGRSVEWRLESSRLQSSQVGSYSLVPVEDGTRVEYRISVTTLMPLLGRLRPRVERRIVGWALNGLRHYVEGRDQ